MSQELIPVSQSISIEQIANEYARQNAFNEYQTRIAKNTRLRQKDDIALFTSFLNEAGMHTGDLMMDWRLLSEIYSLEALLAIEREFLVGAARVYPGWP